MTSSATIATAMQDLRTGKITVDQARAVMRQSREAHGEDAHQGVLLGACRLDLLRTGRKA